MLDRFFRGDQSGSAPESKSGISCYTVMCRPHRAPDLVCYVRVFVPAGPREAQRAGIVGRIVGELSFLWACHNLKPDQS